MTLGLEMNALHGRWSGGNDYDVGADIDRRLLPHSAVLTGWEEATRILGSIRNHGDHIRRGNSYFEVSQMKFLN